MKAKLLIYSVPVLLAMFLFYGYSIQDNPDKEIATNEVATNSLEIYNSTIGEGSFDASSGVLYTQAELVSNPGVGFGGADASAITAPGTLFGFGNQLLSRNRMADDFTIPPGETWNIDSIIVFHYQTGSTLTSSINNVNLQIWNGATPGTGSVVAGDTTTNRLVASYFSNIFRVTATTLTNSQRPIMRNQINMTGTVLTQGTYWIDYTAGGTLASGPWNPPRTIPAVPITGNAFQRLGTTFAWTPALDGVNPQGTPFVIYGSRGCPGPLQPVLTVSDLLINGVPGTLTCGGSLLIDGHNGVATFNVNVSDDGQPGGQVTLLAPVVNLTPPDCKNITYTYNGAPAVFPIVSNNPITLGVRVERLSGSSCAGTLQFIALDDCQVPNTATCGINLDNPLPVELSSFSSSVSGSDVTLNWTTSTETNNSGFDIERSSSNGNWNKVGFVEGHGNSSTSNSYSFTERALNSGIYNYRLKQIDFNGNFEYFNLSNEVYIGTPVEFSLNQNYPNPFNPSTKIEFALPKDGFVSLAIFDNSGREVSRLVNENRSSGYYSVSFNGSGLSSGIYFYRLEVKGSENFVQVRKMMLVK